ncbi:hypothetical protein IU501_10965 [Nocardia otitidiscaviarum]|uniref:hypothetical protein n=1 Tax=Nocardia otitidiscaviarum TaxID=1823 RepID=UPI00189320FD|nr:hypothetical protein [Nocardia otitidiscaviarum]MBF6133520.1 hypothetical protein [Nocardia otitidiscaviarum]
MEWLNPDLVQAFGIAVATVVGAFTAWQAREVKRLQERVAVLEEQMAEERGRFREAVRLIRALFRYIEQLVDSLRRLGEDPPAAPEIPERLAEEI